ncbi:hypothetical protein BS78_02G024500, partial [Paspalum vaginatum]
MAQDDGLTVGPSGTLGGRTHRIDHACATPPPELVDDVIAEILLRFPPEEPEWLFRAALVCKAWLRTVADPAFRRSCHAFHGALPVLGLIHVHETIDYMEYPRVIPTTAVPAFPLPWSDDCRHGRVLVYPRCSAHLDCHCGGPFCVALVDRDCNAGAASARVYSSEEGAWSTPATVGDARFQNSCIRGRGALIGHEIYFLLRDGIVKYDWGKSRLSVIDPPPMPMYEIYGPGNLMVTEDGYLGLAAIIGVSTSFRFHLWSRKEVGSERSVEWVQCRVIDLETMVPMATPEESMVVGFAEGVEVVFIWDTDEGSLFMIELKSGRVKKVAERGDYTGSLLLPCMSFYTPGILLALA